MIALLLAAQLAAAPTSAKSAADPFAAVALERLAPAQRATVSMFGGATGAQAWQRGACGPSPVRKVAQQGAPVARKLGDLPMADHEIAVLRTEGGCPKPVIVRYNIGR